MKIAVIGSGISGLSAAYYLSKKHRVDIFEKEDYFGGHSYTIDLTFGSKKISVDIGFIVFNFKTYPNLINFFKENDVQIEKSDMSFSVSVNNTNFEYCGKGLGGIFSNKLNLFKFVIKTSTRWSCLRVAWISWGTFKIDSTVSPVSIVPGSTDQRGGEA